MIDSMHPSRRSNPDGKFLYVRTGDWFFGAMLFIAAIATYTPLFFYASPIPPNYLFLFLCVFVFVFRLSQAKIPAAAIYVSGFSIFFCTVSSIYWRDLDLILLSTYFITSVFLAVSLGKSTIDAFLTISSWVLAGAVIGAIVGLVYALVGGGPTFQFENPDGRQAYVYLSTITNSVVGNTIRPAGFFDEPGTFSFVLCFVCAMRQRRLMDSRMTWFLLLGGFSSLSFAHGFYVALHALSTRDLRLNSLAIVGVCLLGPLILFPQFLDAISERLFSRYAIVDGRFAGDSRGELIENAWNYLNWESFLWGMDPTCFVKGEACTTEYLSFGENPFSLLVAYGVFISWPYYGLLIALVASSVRNRSFIPIALCLLMMQRPNALGYGFSLLVLLAVVCFIKKVPGQSQQTIRL